MRNKYAIGTGILLIILLAGIGIEKLTKHTGQTQNVSVTKKVKPLPKEVKIILDKNGFTPSQITIKTGSAVRWVNKSSAQQTVNTDNYPTNQLHRELNFGVFNNNSTVMYIFTTPGTYGYHNQFHHEQEGKVIVVN